MQKLLENSNVFSCKNNQCWVQHLIQFPPDQWAIFMIRNNTAQRLLKLTLASFLNVCILCFADKPEALWCQPTVYAQIVIKQSGHSANYISIFLSFVASVRKYRLGIINITMPNSVGALSRELFLSYLSGGVPTDKTY